MAKRLHRHLRQPVVISDIRRRFGTNFAVDDDGQRFLVTTGDFDADTGDATPPTDRINVILNWFEELKRLVPTGR